MLVTRSSAAGGAPPRYCPVARSTQITGFARFEARLARSTTRAHNDSSRSLDFRNDTEVHVLARGKSERSGLEYGGTIEFEADTNTTDNTDETWIFLRGGWGEVRLGDEDGVVDNSVVGGQTIAAGTGGIDGSVRWTPRHRGSSCPTTDDATKIRYYTPSFGGFSVGVSYTPHQEDQQRPTTATPLPQGDVRRPRTWSRCPGL